MDAADELPHSDSSHCSRKRMLRRHGLSPHCGLASLVKTEGA